MPDLPSAAEIRKAIQGSLPLKFRTPTAPREFTQSMELVLGTLLDELGQPEMKEGLFFCLQELISNAKKANNKRVYFQERGMDIANPADYERGMRTFREAVFADVSHYLERMETLGYYVEVLVQRRAEAVELVVSNNIQMVPKEHARVYTRIARSRAFHSVEEAFGAVLDDTEGAGLGLTIVLLYLRKLGLDEDAFQMRSAGGLTTVRLLVPFAKVRLDGLAAIAEGIAAEIEDLPTFPEHVGKLETLLGDANANFAEIAKLISRDPAFTSDLLRYVNSVQFVPNRKVENVVDAVRVAGLRFLRNMFYSYGTHKILTERYPEMRDLWAHSQRVAFYAYQIARTFVKDRQVADDVYVSGILHDVGKIIVNFLYPRLRQNLDRFAADRGVPPTLVESVSYGASHADIGARVARKWNFPAVFVDGIGFHHEPADAPPAHRDGVRVLYLANCVASLGEGRLIKEQIDREVLARFNLEEPDKFDEVRKRLEESYAQSGEKAGP
jgi:putative nucleotidyltransferase with HDIG domain